MNGLLVIMGSGETAPTMVKTHRDIFQRVGPRPAYLLDTPYGFQSNADDISDRAVAHFAASVGRAVEVVRWRTVPPAGVQREQALSDLRAAGWVFAGPGSPTYALRQWRDTPLPGALVDVMTRDGVVVLASAAALTLGSHTVPVYEIYKAGFDPHWVPGLNLVELVTGLPAVVIPHYDNAEGGHHDTRFCYLGEARLAQLEAELPDSSFVLGVDEHTAVVLDPDARTASVVGRGGLTIRRHGHSVVFPTGSVVTFADLTEAASTGSMPTTDASAKTGAPHPTGPTGPAGASPAGPAGPAGASPGAVGAGAAGVGAAERGAPATPTSLGEAADGLAARFELALAARDVDGCVDAVLGLEQTLVDWSADTLSSDEGDRARSHLRTMIVRLGRLAEEGARDPRLAVEPFVEWLLQERARARVERNFTTSDQIRDLLAGAGVEVRDTPDGATWHLQ